MIRRILASLVLAVPLTLVGCAQNGGGKTDFAEVLGGAVGGQYGQYIRAGGHAGGHLLNAAALNEQQEDSIGQSVGVQLTSTYGIVANDRLQKYVALVGLAVASASPRPDLNYVFGVLDTSEVNAFSGPNGYIFVTRGALEHMTDEAELAGVLAHEISHVTHHDGLHQLQAQEQSAAMKSAMEANNQAAQFSALTDAGIDVITKQGYSQPQELDADRAGVQIMSAAGYDPASYLRFLQRLQEQEGAAGGQRLFSTHPAVGQRIKRVAAQMQSLPSGGATLAERFNRHLHATGE